MKRKLVSALVCAAMVATVLAGCGNSSSDTASTDAAATEETATDDAAAEDAAAEDTAAEDTAASGDLIKVGIINNDPNESGYRTANDADMKAMFTEENGYDASFAYSLKNDEQITAAQKFIQDGVDYLLLSAADTAGWDSVLMDAQAAGTRVILFDRTIDADPSLYEASIVSDMEAEGQTAVEWLAGQGLDEYNIIHIQGVMGSAAQQGRTKAVDEMVAANDNWNLVIYKPLLLGHIFSTIPTSFLFYPIDRLLRNLHCCFYNTSHCVKCCLCNLLRKIQYFFIKLVSHFLSSSHMILHDSI